MRQMACRKVATAPGKENLVAAWKPSFCRVLHFMLASLPSPCALWAKAANNPLHGYARAVQRLDSQPPSYAVQALEP